MLKKHILTCFDYIIPIDAKVIALNFTFIRYTISKSIVIRQLFHFKSVCKKYQKVEMFKWNLVRFAHCKLSSVGVVPYRIEPQTGTEQETSLLKRMIG